MTETLTPTIELTDPRPIEHFDPPGLDIRRLMGTTAPAPDLGYPDSPIPPRCSPVPA